MDNVCIISIVLWLYFVCPFSQIIFSLLSFLFAFHFIRPLTALQNKLYRLRIMMNYEIIKINTDSEQFLQLNSLFDDASSILSRTNYVIAIQIHLAYIIFLKTFLKFQIQPQKSYQSWC